MYLSGQAHAQDWKLYPSRKTRPPEGRVFPLSPPIELCLKPCRSPLAQACNRTSAYCVPLYDSLGENAIEFIINHSEATIVFVASDKAANLAQALPMCKDHVETVVIWGPKDAGVATVRHTPCVFRCAHALM